MERRVFIKSLIACLLLNSGAKDIFAGEYRKFYSKHSAQDDSHVKDYLLKMKNFDQPFSSDVYLTQKKLLVLKSTVSRLKRVQRTVGYGNFHLYGIDDAIKIARNYSKVGRFKKEELTFMEEIFFHKASDYGFIDKKPISGFTDNVNKRDSVKVPGTGHYLYRGTPLATYEKIKKDLGDQVILTSGIRSVVKQFLLFLDKAKRNNGNLSLASRSLAPPGYSFHSQGDFDVGQVNFGVANFTDRFTTTEVYQNLISLGYSRLRYEKDNLLGVRFEPWHIKLTS